MRFENNAWLKNTKIEGKQRLVSFTRSRVSSLQFDLFGLAPGQIGVEFVTGMGEDFVNFNSDLTRH
jgi:hypothetical protein